MIECPRCGFQQPQDRYCANCGVDIERYNPPKKSAVVKTLSNPIVYFIVGVGFIAVLFLVAKHNLPTQVAEEPTPLGEVSTLSRTDATTTEQQPTTPVAATKVAQTQPAETKPVPKAQPQKPKVEPRKPKPTAEIKAAPRRTAPTNQNTEQARSRQQEALAALETQSDPPEQQPDAPPVQETTTGEAQPTAVQAVQLQSVDVSFSEVLNSQLEAAAAQGQVVQESGSFRVIRVKKTVAVGGQRLPGQRTLRRLGAREEFINFDIPLPPGGAATNLVLNLQVGIVRAEPDSTELAIEIDSAFAEVSSLSFTVSLPSDEQLLIVGAAPRAEVPAETQGLGATPLRVVNSESFQNGQSELVIALSAE